MMPASAPRTSAFAVKYLFSGLLFMMMASGPFLMSCASTAGPGESELSSELPEAPVPDMDDAGWAEEYREIAEALIDESTSEQRMDEMWERLAHLTDYYPHRLSGSDMLEDAIDWMQAGLEEDGFENVRKQEVMVPHWVRNEESAVMHGPYEKELRMLGLGGSVGTPPEGIRAEVLVVGSFEELEERAAEAEGKIVVWNVPFTTYGATVQYRVHGATAAARAGAVASLIRSVGPFSMQTPHTGNSRYADDVNKIPHAAITLEDAELMQRFQDRGEPVEVHLTMGAETLPDALSYNVMGELRGSERPEEVVVLGGHIDSWDIGHGVMDCGAGIITTWEAVRMMKVLGLRPKRTIRVVGWTNEENGVRGGVAYRDMIMNNNSFEQHQLAYEIDFGAFEPYGFGFTGSEAAMEMLEPVLSLTESIGVTELRSGSSGTVDIGPLRREGMPIMGIDVDTSKYFWYHHTDADTMDKQNPEHVAKVIAATAVMIYVVADMDERLPWE
jgi:carboxypeptidase Q